MLTTSGGATLNAGSWLQASTGSARVAKKRGGEHSRRQRSAKACSITAASRGAQDVYRYCTVPVSGYLTIRNIRRLFYGVWIYLDHAHQLSVSTRWQNSHYPVNPDGAGASRIHALHTVQSEPIFDNWRFSIDIDEDVAKRWMKFIGLQRIYDVIDGAHARIFTDDEMNEYTYTHAPRYLKGAAARTFSDDLMSTWPAIKTEITPAIIQAAISRDQPKSGDYLHIEWTNRNTQIALLKIRPTR